MFSLGFLLKKEKLIRVSIFLSLLLFFNFHYLFSKDYSPYLGSVPSEVVNKMGAPLEVGIVEVKPDPPLVYFLYEDYSYYLFFDNRVWAIRFDSRFKSSVQAIKIGYSKDEVKRILSQQLGEPKKIDKSYMVYALPYQGFSAELRVFFKDTSLNEIYIYRSDY